MKILVAWEMPDAALDDLRTLGCDVVSIPDAAGAAFLHELREATALVIGRTPLPADAIAAAKSLQIIVRCGSEASNIAIDEASTQGVFVCTTPHRTALAVAEMMLGMMLTLDRQLVWKKGESGPATLPHGLAGRTLGLLGYSHAGRALARRAAALEMNVLAWSPTETPESLRGEPVSLCTWSRDVARQSDVIAVHADPADGEDMLLDAEFIESIREGADVVFVGHPGGLDESALESAIKSRRLRVAIDWIGAERARETARSRSRLADLPTVLMTVGLAERTMQARVAVAAEAVRVLRQFFVAGAVENCINLLSRSPATWQLVLRLRDAVGVMAGIMDAIRSDGINAEEIGTRVFVGARAAWCTIAVDERPSTEALAAIRALPGVLHLELRAVV